MHIPHGHSVHQQQMERVGGPSPAVSVAHGKPSGPTGGFAVEDQVDLSATARNFLASADHASGPGKSMHSAAHRVRAIIAENPHLAGMPFGQVVAQLNHGTLDLTPPAAPGDSGETGEAVPDTGDLSEIPAADGEVATPAEGEGADSAFLPTAEGGTATALDGAGEPIFQPLLEDGPDAIAGDDGATDGTVVAEGEGPASLAEPAVSVDTTATLLDMLNDADGSETETEQAA